MKWRSRAKEIERLRAKLKGARYRAPFPDLSVEQNVAPLGNGFGKCTPKARPISGAKQFPVGNSHKQGPELITPGMLRDGSLAYMGGKKPN